MQRYISRGGKKLFGEVDVSGSKNASLPILAATIISGKRTKLYNLPDIEEWLPNLAEDLGVSICTIRFWETNKRNISIKSEKRVLEYCRQKGIKV